MSNPSTAPIPNPNAGPRFFRDKQGNVFPAGMNRRARRFELGKGARKVKRQRQTALSRYESQVLGSD